MRLGLLLSCGLCLVFWGCLLFGTDCDVCVVILVIDYSLPLHLLLDFVLLIVLFVCDAVIDGVL